MVHQWKMTPHTHSSLDFKSQRWCSCIWLWAKTWKNEFMLGLVCFCYLLIRKIPVLFLMQRLCICIIYFTPIASLDFIWKINTETSITFFFLLVYIFVFSPYRFLCANHEHVNTCVSLCAVAERREGTAGRPTLNHVLTCFAFTCYST